MLNYQLLNLILILKYYIINHLDFLFNNYKKNISLKVSNNSKKSIGLADIDNNKNDIKPINIMK